MISIWIWDIPLPPGLEFLGRPWASALATLVFWLLIALVLQSVVFALVKAAARRSDTDIDDVIVEVSRAPLILVVILAGIGYSFEALGMESELAGGVRRWLTAAIMALVTYWAWRMLKEVVLHYGEILARRSETRTDDVLVPIVNQFAPIVIYSIGGAVILEHLGVRLDALLVAIGGAAFIMAFALQDILSNVFSGLALLVDTPFRYGDLITLEDGKVCQVIKIGVRVTQLYDIGAHAVIYAPNSKLASERLTNLMQPTPELISVVSVEVGRENDPERVRQLLNEVLLGHPDLLGNLDAKLQRLDGFLTLPPDKRANGAARLSAEREVDRAVSTAVAELRDFAGAIRTREKRGLSRDERLDLLSRFEPLRRSIGWLDGPTIPEAEYQRGDEDLLDRGLPAGSLARLGWDWVRLWTQDPDLVEEEDLRRLRAYWGERILALLRRVEGIRSKLERGGGLELRLDDHVLRVVAWIRKEFKHKTPAWKESGTGFKGLVEGGYRFNMVFYVDNIELEHFERQGRVEGQIRREVFRRLTEEGVALPAPKYEVALRGSALTEAKERLSA